MHVASVIFGIVLVILTCTAVLVYLTILILLGFKRIVQLTRDIMPGNGSLPWTDARLPQRLER